MQNLLGGIRIQRELTAEEEEERMLQRAIEESKADMDNDPNNPNPDNMTYEQMLALEDRNGKVSKGLKLSEIKKIKEKIWRRKTDTTKKEETCSICFEKYKLNDKVKELKNCQHSYHSSCIDKWLKNEKRCPVCNDEV